MGLFSKGLKALKGLGVEIPILSFSSILKQLIKFLSDFVDLVSPDQLSPEQLETLQDLAGTLYAAGKNFGVRWVQDTTNDLDDVILTELLEIIEQAAAKYNLELNPTAIPFP